MMWYYRRGWPFGKTVSMMGFPTVIRIDVIRDDEAGVFVATSRDVKGLVVEADSLEDVMRESKSLIPELLDLPTERDVARVCYSDRVAHA